jgi:hypothetical protein
VTFEARATRYVTDEELARQRGLGGAWTWRSALTLAGAALVATALMAASRYTFSLGLLIVLIIALVLAMPSIVRRDRRRRRSWVHLAGAQEHGVSSEEIWLRTAQVELRSSWANLATWTHADGCVRLWCHGMPPVLLPESALIEAGCLTQVLQLAGYWATPLI